MHDCSSTVDAFPMPRTDAHHRPTSDRRPPSLTVAVAVLVAFLAFTYQAAMFGYGGRSGRVSLAASVARRTLDDAQLAASDKSHWYSADPAAVANAASRPHLAERFVPGRADEETEAFVEESMEKSDWLFTQLWHNLAKTILGWIGYTQTDINGMLRRGSMFVVSERHFLAMVEVAAAVDPSVEAKFSRADPLESTIDLGAGDGRPTAFLRPYFKHSYATEASSAMRKILDEDGVDLLEIDSWHADREFDLVTCLNLLDRCETPRTVMSQVRLSLRRPGGLALFAVVLPFKPYVEFSTTAKSDDGSGDAEAPDRKKNQPLEVLPVSGSTFESQAGSLAVILEEEGFEVLSWTRVPYICEGDLGKSIYTLNDALFLVRRRD